MYIFELNIFWIHITPSYYGLMYALSFIVWYLILRKISFLNKKDIEDLFFYIILWVVLWWRLWYVLFYNIENYLKNPLDIIKVWEWWMSFHWWLIGVILALIIFSKIKKINLLKLSDDVAFLRPIWLFFWRIWNYINKELLWFEYNWFLAVEKNWKHFFPSPLLEAFLEWIVIFIILFFIRKNKKFNWQIAWYFLLLYWIFRIFVEFFFRTPDQNIGYIFWFLTMGIILSFPLIIFWIILLTFFKKWN